MTVNRIDRKNFLTKLDTAVFNYQYGVKVNASAN